MSCNTRFWIFMCDVFLGRCNVNEP